MICRLVSRAMARYVSAPLLLLCAFSGNAQVSSPQPETLADLTKQALDTAPSLRLALQKQHEAEAHVSEVRAAWHPVPILAGSVSGSHGRVADPSQTQDYVTVDAALALILPNGRRVRAQVGQALANLATARTAFQRARFDILFRTDDAYLGLLRAEGARRAARENLDQAHSLLAAAQKRVDAGDIPPADLLKARLPVSQAAAALARTESTERAARQALNSLLSRSLNAPLNIAELNETVADLPEVGLLVATAAHSPDVRDAEAAILAAKATIDAVRRADDPEFGVQLQHTITTDITAYANLTTLGINVTLPIGSSGASRNRMKQAQIQLTEAQSALAVAKQQTELAVRQAVLNIEADAANLTAVRETAGIAQESLVKAQQAFAAGLTTTREVLDAQLELAHARTETNAALYDLAGARAKLYQIIGKEMNP